MSREAVSGFTIDASHSKDLDDAIWVEPCGDGLLVFVSIADVAAQVPVGSEADAKAAAAGFTRYRGHGKSRPMFDEEAAFSLLPDGTRRPVLTLCVTVDSSGNPQEFTPLLCDLEHRGRLSYGEADAILRGEKQWEHADRLRRLDTLAQVLLHRRRENGALAVYDVERGWATDEEGRVVPLGRSAHRSNVIVQEAMILVNRAAADWLADHEKPALYRNHAIREDAADFDRQTILSELDDIFHGASVEAIMALRSRIAKALCPAEYGPVATGHYGLNTSAYTHITSPIRRYADLVNQRIVRALVAGEPVPYDTEAVSQLAKRINETVVSTKASAVNRYKAAVDRQARRSLTGNQLDALPASDFLRVIEVACRENWFSDSFAEAFIKRLHGAEGSTRLQERDLYPILFEADRRSLPEIQVPVYERIVDAVVAWMLQRPASAVTLLKMAEAKEDVGPVQYDTRGSGSADRPVFTGLAQVKVGGRQVKSKAFKASSKKAAQQGAALVLVSRLLDLDDPPVEVLPGAVAGVVREAAVAVSAAAVGENAVGVLHEYAAKSKKEPPAYEFVSGSGPSHAPTFTCTCRFLGRECQAVGATKKAAKQAASVEMAKLVIG